MEAFKLEGLHPVGYRQWLGGDNGEFSSYPKWYPHCRYVKPKQQAGVRSERWCTEDMATVRLLTPEIPNTG